MKLKIFVNMLIAALVVFIVFNLFVPMSVTVVNEGFSEGTSMPEETPTANPNAPPEQQQNAQMPPEMAGYPNPNTRNIPPTPATPSASGHTKPPSAPTTQVPQKPAEMPLIQPMPL